MLKPRRPTPISANVDGSGTASRSDCAFTVKVVEPTPGNVTEPANTVCKLPVSTMFGGVRFEGVSMPFSPSDWNSAWNPIGAPAGDKKVNKSRMSLTPIPPPSRCMLPGWMSALAIISVLVPVTLPTLTLADSRLVVIVAPTMSVVTTIGPVPVGSYMKEITAALAGLVMAATMSTTATNRSFACIHGILLNFSRIFVLTSWYQGVYIEPHPFGAVLSSPRPESNRYPVASEPWSQ
jgi:hypothetical protein